ncbi:MAG: hypothetical protein AAGB34_00795 [Planctomycetota bacterium]
MYRTPSTTRLDQSPGEDLSRDLTNLQAHRDWASGLLMNGTDPAPSEQRTRD